MQKLSIRKISILGLVLMAASAVTAAVLPSKSNKNADKFADGSLTHADWVGINGNLSSLTCAADTGIDGVTAPCNHSTVDPAGTETTTFKASGSDSTSVTINNATLELNILGPGQ